MLTGDVADQLQQLERRLRRVEGISGSLQQNFMDWGHVSDGKQLDGADIFQASNIVLASGGYIRAGQTAYNTGTGWWIGTVGATPKASMGVAGGQGWTWDGTTFAITGTLTVTGGNAMKVDGTNSTAASVQTLSSNMGVVTIGSGGSVSSGQTAYNTGTGWWIGNVATVPKFSIGNPAGNYLTWDGTNIAWAGVNTSLTAAGLFTATNATITGAITATSGSFTGTITSTAGTIGGWTLTATTLYAGAGPAAFMGMISTAGTGVAFFAGASASDGTGAVFKVSAGGALTATSATITGAITATSGTVGSFTIGTYLYTGTKTAWNDANAGVHVGSDGIGVGNNVFTVNGSTGALTATSATITGTITTSNITATGGTVGGWTLGATTLTSTGVTLTSTGGIKVQPATTDQGYLRFLYTGDTSYIASMYTLRASGIDFSGNSLELDVQKGDGSGQQFHLSLGGAYNQAAFTGNISLRQSDQIRWPQGQIASAYIDYNGTYIRLFGQPVFLTHSLYPGNQTTHYISGSSAGIGIDTTAPTAITGYTVLDVMNSGSGSFVLARSTTNLVTAQMIGDGGGAQVIFGSRSNHPVAIFVNNANVATFNAGMIIGAPTGGDKGAGTLNCTGLYVNNVAHDYVFEPSYKLLTISEMRAYYEREKHLPTIPTRAVFMEGSMNVGELNGHLWETAEVHARYIAGIDSEIQMLKSRVNDLESQLAVMRN